MRPLYERNVMNIHVVKVVTKHAAITGAIAAAATVAYDLYVLYVKN